MISTEYIGKIKGRWAGAGEFTPDQKKPRLSEIEKWLKSRENPERNRYNPDFRDDRERNLRPEIIRRDLTEDSIRRILYKHLIVQTLLIFWILLILLIKLIQFLYSCLTPPIKRFWE